MGQNGCGAYRVLQRASCGSAEAVALLRTQAVVVLLGGLTESPVSSKGALACKRQAANPSGVAR